jgi:Leucine-rich repeat (LRR) protein
MSEVKIMRDRLADRRARAAVIVLGIWTLGVDLSAAGVRPPGTVAITSVTKVLHFPKDQHLGVLEIEDQGRGSEFVRAHFDPSLPWGLDPQLVNLHMLWEFVAVAHGDVAVPAGRDVALRIILKPRPSELTLPNLRDRCFPDPEDLTGLSGLDPNDLGMLFVASLGERTYADERVVKPLSRLTGLKMLSLSLTGVTDKGMEHLRSLRSLRSLELMEHRVGDAGSAVLKDLPALEYLDLDTATTDAGLKDLGQLPKLRWLRVRTGKIRGPGLAELANLPRLERLCLWGETGLTDQHVKCLEGLTHLKSLTLWGAANPPLTDASLASIAKLTSLEELYFVRLATRFTGAGIAHLESLKNLKTVDFGISPIDDAGGRHLAGMAGLTTIKGGLALTPETAKTLTSSRDLKSLDVRLADRDTLVAVAPLSALTSLEELGVFGPFEPGRSVRASASTENLTGLEPLGGLKRLMLCSDELTDRDMASIGKLRQMESLTLRVTRTTKRGLNQLSGLTNLQTLSVVSGLSLAESGGIDEVPLNLSAFTNLKTLSLSGLSLQDMDVASMAGLRHLEWLNLNGTFTEETLSYLKDLSELKLLDITGVTCVNGEGLAQLGGLKRLEDLTVRGRITDTALARLPVLASLWSLRIVTDEPIRPETVGRLKQILPMIEYIHIDKPSLPDQPLIRSSPAPPRRGPVNLPTRRTPRRLR